MIKTLLSTLSVFQQALHSSSLQCIDD